MKKVLKQKNGITLIALVITIIVLLILAGISITMLSGENSILQRVGQARDDSVVSREEESVKLAYMSAKTNCLGGNVTEQSLQEELDKLVGNNKTKVTEKDNDILNVLYYDTTNTYNVENGNVSQVEILKLYISNYAELLDFANRVNDGNTFENYIVYLNNDIEMEDEEWVVIGTIGNRDFSGINFKGVFEGNNHTISNLSLTTYKKYNGLFNQNEGIIQNLNVIGSMSGNPGSIVGLISGINLGIINNCSVMISCDVTNHDVNQAYLRLGGITGSNSGIISNCITRGEIHTFSQNEKETSTGGITSTNNSEIINCKNYANIYRKNSKCWWSCG